MSNPIIQHLKDLRQAMFENGIDLFIQPSSDPHLSEYVSDRFKSRHFLTGFTGSAGTAIVTKTQAVLYTDGRYFIQAEKELKNTTIKLMKIGTEGYPEMNEWVRSQLTEQMTVAVDGRLISHSDFAKLKAALKGKSPTYITHLDLMTSVWQDRPDFPKSNVFLHDLKYTGRSTQEKINHLREEMVAKEGDHYMLSSLNDLAWLFNIRANDVAFTPVPYTYGLITLNQAFLYIDAGQVSDTIIEALTSEGVTIKPYTDYYHDLAELKQTAMIFDPTKVNAEMTRALDETNTCIEVDDLTYRYKACISPTEKANWQNAQLRDGVAMVNFLHWFDTNIPSGKITELDAEKRLVRFRADQDLFIEPSFKTISAYGPNGAMMHYSTPEEASPLIGTRGLYLLDSGGQYYDGTTDITRTMATGPLTEEEKRDFTLVLIAHIRLNQITFLKGVTGTNIDIIARQVMWENHMDYKSGTGHSIGYLLGVHEGPARIRKEPSNVILEPGMVLTNEPGVYKENQYGIRLENTVVVETLATNDSGTYLGFEVISFCPIDTRCVLPEMMTPKERAWLNTYHEKVHRLLSPYVSPEVETWLKNATKPI